MSVGPVHGFFLHEVNACDRRPSYREGRSWRGSVTVQNHQISVQTSGKTDIIDLTEAISGELNRSSIQNGMVSLFIPGSTAALTTIEYERGVINDLKKTIERMAPEDLYYEHNERWGDGNGYSHVRAALTGPSLQIPVIDGKMALGTWQQIVLMDFDNRARERRIIVQIAGE
jgi:secondary thiamine-phosphate synthase enzyme